MEGYQQQNQQAQQQIQVQQNRQEDQQNLQVRRNVVREEKKLSEKDENAFRRMLQHAKNKELKEALEKRTDIGTGDWVELESEFQSGPIQKLPAWSTDKKWKNAEMRAITEAKKHYSDADLCTVREMAYLKKYFKKWKDGKAPEIKGSNKANDPVLTDYVNSILKFSLTEKHLTDEYLSKHIAQLYDLRVNLSAYPNMVKQYPAFFGGLSEAKRERLAGMANMANSLEVLLNSHMRVHGISVSMDGQVHYARVEKDKARRRQEKERNQRNYEMERSDFFKNFIQENALVTANLYIKDKSFSSVSTLLGVAQSVRSNEKAMGAAGPEINDAIAEINKVLQIRDQFIKHQEEYVKDYRSATGNAKETLLNRIKTVNLKIKVISSQADAYKEFIDFAMGKISKVSKDTMALLKAEQKDNLMEMIHFKLVGDCLEDARTAKEELLLKTDLEQAEAKYKAAKDLLDPNVIKAKKKAIRDNEKEISRLAKSIPKSAPEEREKLQKKMEKLTIETGALQDWIKQSEQSKTPMGLATMNSELRDAEKAYKDAKAKQEKGVEYNGMASARFLAEWKATAEQREMAKAGKDLQKKLADMKTGQKAFCEKAVGEQHLQKRPDRIFASTLDPMMVLPGDANLFATACMTEPTDDTSEAFKEQVVQQGIMPLLKEMLSLDGDTLNEMTLAKNMDVTKPSFWKCFTLCNYGTDMTTFLDILKAWDVAISDEEFQHLRAVGTTLQAIQPEYMKYYYRMHDSAYHLAKKLGAETAGDFNENIMESLEEESVQEKLLRKYSEENLGTTRAAYDSNGNPVNDISIHRYTQMMLGDVVFVALVAKNSIGTPDELLQQDKERVRELYPVGDIARQKAIAEETGNMHELYPQYGEQELALRMGFRAKKMNETDLGGRYISGIQESRWNKTFYREKKGAADIKAFKVFLRRLEVDANKALKPEDKDALKANKQDIADYLSGDQEKRERVLARFGKEVAAIEVKPEMLSFEYMKAHYFELQEMVEKVVAFQGFYTEYAGFFDGSEMFTEKERDLIRANMADISVFTDLKTCLDEYRKSLGYDEKLREISAPSRFKTKAEKQNWAKQESKTAEDSIKLIFQQKIPLSLQAYQKNRNRKLTATDRKAESLAANILQTKAELSREKIELKQKIGNLNLRDAEFGVERAKSRVTAIDKQIAQLERSETLLAELKSYLSGEKELAALSKEAIVFSGDNELGIFDEKTNDEALRAVIIKELDEKWKVPAEKDKLEEEIAFRKKSMEYRRLMSEGPTEKEMARFRQLNFGIGADFADERCFKSLLGYINIVHRDATGKPLPQYEENARRNTEMVEDFCSGDVARRNKVLKQFGQKVLSLADSLEYWENLPKEQAMEEMKKNYWDFFMIERIKFEFQNYYTGYKDFYESEAFTEEEQDRLRYIMSSNTFDMLTALGSQYENSHGLSEGRPVPIAANIKEELIRGTDKKIQTATEIITGMTPQLDVTKQKDARQKELFQSNPTVVRNLSKLDARLRGEIRELTIAKDRRESIRLYNDVVKNINIMTKGKSKQEKDEIVRRHEEKERAYTEKRNELDGFGKYVELVQSWLYDTSGGPREVWKKNMYTKIRAMLETSNDDLASLERKLRESYNEYKAEEARDKAAKKAAAAAKKAQGGTNRR